MLFDFCPLFADLGPQCAVPKPRLHHPNLARADRKTRSDWNREDSKCFDVER